MADEIWLRERLQQAPLPKSTWDPKPIQSRESIQWKFRNAAIILLQQKLIPQCIAILDESRKRFPNDEDNSSKCAVLKARALLRLGSPAHLEETVACLRPFLAKDPSTWEWFIKAQIRLVTAGWKQVLSASADVSANCVQSRLKDLNSTWKANFSKDGLKEVILSSGSDLVDLATATASADVTLEAVWFALS